MKRLFYTLLSVLSVICPLHGQSFTPNRIVFAKTSTTSGTIPTFMYDPTNNRLGIFSTQPQSAVHINAPTLISDYLTVHSPTDQIGLVTIGQQLNVDLSVWQNSRVRIGHLLNYVGGSVNNNEWALNVQALVNPTNSILSYERAAGIFQITTADPSIFGGSPISRDAVGIHAQAVIKTGNTTGRAFGGNLIASAQSSADGTLQGLEIDVDGGADQPEVSQDNSKGGLSIVAETTTGQNITTGISMVGHPSGAKIHKGIWAPQGAFIDSFIEMDKASAFTDIFRVDMDGKTRIGDLPGGYAYTGTCTTSPNTCYSYTYYGNLAVNGFATVVSPTNSSKTLGLITEELTSTIQLVSNDLTGNDLCVSGCQGWPITFNISTTGHNDAEAARIAQASQASAGTSVDTNTFLQLTGSFTGASPKSATGTVGLRNNAGVLEVSSNGGTWGALGGVGGTGTARYVPRWNTSSTLTDSLIYQAASGQDLFGISTTDVPIGISGNGNIVANYVITVVDAAANAHLGEVVVDGVGTAITFASGHTGSASDWPLTFKFSTAGEVGRFATNGTMLVGITSTDLSTTTGWFLASNIVGVVTGATNASTLTLGISGGSYTQIASGVSGSGTYLPISFNTNATEAARIQTDHSVLVGLTSSDASGIGSGWILDNSVIGVVTGALNAAAIALDISPGSYTRLSSSATGSGTALPLEIWAGAPAAVTSRFLTSGSDRVCVYVSGALHLLTLSGGNFVDGGTC